ncbi:gfo/Idh/MocA family oxidoreductase, partial [Klebsiella pneumoniae]|nr:gfo/Idh/MocA family oxidoreductase [Klebsiella pneumoniae]
AMWTRFQPAVVALRELVADGAIGEVRSVQADLGVSRTYDPVDRLFALELGGGALLDLGVYVVSFAQMLLGT